MIKESILCCDYCKKIIEKVRYLESIVFYEKDKKNLHFYFCSWKCFFNKMKKVKTDYFISLPILNYRKDKETIPASEFWKCIKRV